MTAVQKIWGVLVGKPLDPPVARFDEREAERETAQPKNEQER